MRRDVRVFRSLSELSAAAAVHAAALLSDTVASSGRCRLVLAGGETPKTLYEMLASRFGATIPWQHAHVFWGDERYVPHTDARSNYHMARETLLDHVPCPADQVHPMPTHFTRPSDAAREYDRLLDVALGGGAAFDVVFLGLGADGHIASVFPGSPAIDDRSHWALGVTAPIEPATRLTLTVAALQRSRRIMMLAAGESKAAALRDTLAASADPRRHPAAALVRSHPDLTWWVDEQAAALLDESDRREVAHG